MQGEPEADARIHVYRRSGKMLRFLPQRPEIMDREETRRKPFRRRTPFPRCSESGKIEFASALLAAALFVNAYLLHLLGNNVYMTVAYVSDSLLARGSPKTNTTSLDNYADAPWWREGSGEFLAALDTLYRRQHPEPSGCNKTIHVPVGGGGGLGSMIQFVSRKVVDALASEEADVVLALEGQLKRYTLNPRCKELSGGGGWGCFFAEPTNCTEARRKPMWGGDRKMALAEALQDSLPANFSAAGPGFWWGVIQAYLTRLNVRMQKRLAEVKHAIDYGRGPRAPRISMHLRFGDKQRDTASQQNGVSSGPSAYFRQAELIAERINSEECSNSMPCGPVGVFIATDSAEALAEAIKWNESTPSIRLVTAFATASQNVSANGIQVAIAPLEENDPRLYQLAEEAVLDLSLLLGPDHFVGLCMSQIARIVANIGFARGSLKEAIAMDHINIDRHDRWKLSSSSKHMPWRQPRR